MSTGADLSGASMFDLFKMEAETQCAVLNEGLLAIESNPGDLARIEPLMRAAHSMKGAARIVGLDLVVRLAHAMEDCLVGAQKGEERLMSARIDQLLQGVDRLVQLASMAENDVAAWTEQHAGDIDALITSIEAPAPPPPQDTPEPGESQETATAPETPAAAETPVPPAAPVAAETPPAAPPPTAAPGDAAFVRVGAERLNRLMQLAGESVVEARRIQAFRHAMHELRAGQRQLDSALEAAQLHGDGTERLEEVRHLATRAREQIRHHAAEVEETLRRSQELSTSLYHEVLGSRMRPFEEGTAAFPRLVRDLARELGKKASFEVRGAEVPVDRDILAKLEAPLNHMVRNCVDHGLETPDARRAAGKPESGRITLEARHHAGMLTVQLQDDGRGIDPDAVRRRAVERGLVEASFSEALDPDEILEFLFLPGFSTASEVTAISGRGVGLDVVQSMVQEVSGTVRIESEPGRSTTFTLRLPITLSVVRAAIVEIAGEPYACPLTSLGRILQVDLDQLTPVEGRQQFTLDGHSIGLVQAAEILGLTNDAPDAEAISVMVLGEGDRQCGLAVDRFLGEQDLVVRKLDARLGKVPHISAAAVLENGDPVFIVDCEDVMQSMQQLLQEGRLRRMTVKRDVKHDAQRRVLVVDDSITVREVERQLLARHGYAVDVAVDGQDGWNALQTTPYDLVVTDVDMPRMNGFELIRTVRRDARMASLPIIIVSYKDRKEDRMQGMEAGANAYLTKHSFHDDSLVTMVSDLIGQAPD